jgi:TonB family protein
MKKTLTLLALLAQSAAAPAQTAPVLSESKFLGVLYAEIAKHTPEDSQPGAGEVTASFRVNAAGKVDTVKIEKSTSPAHAEVVKKILSEVQTPPPPGGSMDVGQTFRFHPKGE